MEKIYRTITIKSEKFGTTDFLCSAEDYDELIKISWRVDNGYANSKLGRMHRVVMKLHGVDLPSECPVDHKNRLRNDNRFENLEVSTATKNANNRTKKKGASSIYYGVSFSKSEGKFVASFISNKTHHWIGQFENEEDAAEAYDRYVAHKVIERSMNNPQNREKYKAEPLLYPKEKKSKKEYCGVFVKKSGKYEACVISNKKRYAKLFEKEIDAAKHYDKLVTDNGLDRKLNFPEDHPDYKPAQQIKTIITETLEDGKVVICSKRSPKTSSIIDLDDYDRIKYHAITTTGGTNDYLNIKMGLDSRQLSRFIMDEADPTVIIDHIDSDRKNNSKSNLRRSNRQLNATNKLKQKGTSSLFHGVSIKEDKWLVCLTDKKQRILYKKHTTEENAARHYDLFVLNMENNHRKLNFTDWTDELKEDWKQKLKLE